MQRLAIGALALTLLGAAAAPQDDKAQPKLTAPAREFKALYDEFRQLEAGAIKTFKEAKSDTDKKKVFEDYEKKTRALAGRALTLAQTHGNDVAAVDALQMVMVRNLGSEADQDKALSMLRTFAEKGPDKTVQAHAAFHVGEQVKQQYDDSNQTSEAGKKLALEAEALFGRTVKQLAGAGDARSKEVVKAAEKQLFELQNLVVGKMAPDIEGTDADGKKLRLSDYRGKVVVLDFWASWCVPCMAMVPHERELVKRLEGKPFALLGVNLDQTAAELKKTEAAHKMTWRSFFDGPQGPIADKWNIESIPAIYVLDHQGVIRYKGVREKELDKAVDTLLKEVPAAKK